MNARICSQCQPCQQLNATCQFYPLRIIHQGSLVDNINLKELQPELSRMKPVIGKNERNAENLVQKQQQKRKRSYKLESKESIDDIPRRAIGRDGHYFVCMKCDYGGKLLCCDSCACTYHLQCLDPPLYSTPKGYWQCPNCDHDDLSEPKANHKRLASNNRSSNSKEDASYTCSICANTEKILVLTDDESDKLKSPEFNSKVGNLPMENQEGTSVRNADSCGTSTQKSPDNEPDKLLVLREALPESMNDIGKSKQLSNPASMEQKQSSDQQAFRHMESAPLYRWGGARDLLSSMSLGGQDIPISNTSLLSMFSSTVMGEPLSFGAGTSSDAMVVIPTPRGLLKWKAPIVSWSEEELDALWVGVRRYGAGNWDAILGDPSLNCLKNKTQEDLSARWNKDLRKFLGPAPISSMPIRPKPPLNAMGSSFFWAPQLSANTNREPVNGELLLGGYFPLTNFGLNKNMNAGHGSRETHTLPKHAPSDNVLVDDYNYDADIDDDSDYS
ncbi:hypothetical protein L6164_022868 [Bauhinia variegata]|uniref:Uncharacterized protein n=1 Tax=Bauhinia variegata TaxID=167791 RepID=A0ACB9MGI4_BAUVA|nr:hypothetical protein L6164_022868 [Bauhinia variegata]